MVGETLVGVGEVDTGSCGCIITEIVWAGGEHDGAGGQDKVATVWVGGIFDKVVGSYSGECLLVQTAEGQDICRGECTVGREPIHDQI